MLVVKRDGNRVVFDREKLMNSMVLACGKRPVGLEVLRESVERIEAGLFDGFDLEVSTQRVGEAVMEELYAIDSVAYIRYASVYREFACPEEFAEIVRRMGRVGAR